METCRVTQWFVFDKSAHWKHTFRSKVSGSKVNSKTENGSEMDEKNGRQYKGKNGGGGEHSRRINQPLPNVFERTHRIDRSQPHESNKANENDNGNG